MYVCYKSILCMVVAADRSAERGRELRRLVQALPAAHYATLRYLVQHLRRVAAHSAANKMEPRNLAIVFGPTLVRAASDDMLAMVNDMSSQCRIIESFLIHVREPHLAITESHILVDSYISKEFVINQINCRVAVRVVLRGERGRAAGRAAGRGGAAA